MDCLSRHSVYFEKFPARQAKIVLLFTFWPKFLNTWLNIITSQGYLASPWHANTIISARGGAWTSQSGFDTTYVFKTGCWQRIPTGQFPLLPPNNYNIFFFINFLGHQDKHVWFLTWWLSLILSTGQYKVQHTNY